MTTSIPRVPVPETLPHTYSQAALRGLRCKCPRCGEAPLFRKWLKPVDQCSHCGQDWSSQRADDFPAYVSIFITGHALAPLMILLLLDYQLSAWLSAAILFPLAIVMMLAILQPAKGAIIAHLWWLGMSGFRQERPAPSEPDAPR